MRTENSSIIIPSVEMEDTDKVKKKRFLKNDGINIEPLKAKKKMKSHQSTKESLPPKTGALVSTKVYKMKYLGEAPTLTISNNLTTKNTKLTA